MKKPSRNLWSVKMQHMAWESLWVLAPTAESAGQKAIRLCRREDQLKSPVVKSVTFSGTIDAF